MGVKTQLLNLGRKILNPGNNKYTYIASTYNLDNYKLISSGELNIRGKDLDIPAYIRDFVSEQNEILMIGSKYNNEVHGIVLRGLKEKVFMSYGFNKGTFYGLGDLNDTFKYGDPLILLESAIDRDVCKLFISRNSIALLTSSLSKNQIQVISNLTNRVILLLDNDEAGNTGEEYICRNLNKLGVKVDRINS